MGSAAAQREEATDEEKWRLAKGAFVGKYRIVGRLGRGGMGQVYEAHHVDLGTVVAIKVCDDEQGDSAQRFAREARAMARLKSRYAVRVFDVGTLESGEAFMVMERLVGRDLATVQIERSLSWQEVTRYIAQVCEVLVEAHAMGIVHRDLKPQNLFLVDGEPPSIRVLDFGLAKGAPNAGLDDLTRSHELVGTPAFMAPEQFTDGRCAAPSIDIWGVGVCLYRLLTGEYPFRGTNFGVVAAEILKGTPRPLRELRPDVPMFIEGIVARCLMKDPARRFPSAQALADSLVAAHSMTGAAVPMNEPVTSGAFDTHVDPQGMTIPSTHAPVALVTPMVADVASSPTVRSAEPAPTPRGSTREQLRPSDAMATMSSLGVEARAQPDPPDRTRAILGVLAGAVVLLAVTLTLVLLVNRRPSEPATAPPPATALAETTTSAASTDPVPLAPTMAADPLPPASVETSAAPTPPAHTASSSSTAARKVEPVKKRPPPAAAPTASTKDLYNTF